MARTQIPEQGFWRCFAVELNQVFRTEFVQVVESTSTCSMTTALDMTGPSVAQASVVGHSLV